MQPIYIAAFIKQLLITFAFFAKQMKPMKFKGNLY